MDIYAKGQLSFLILNCLLDRDFYGLDILAEVKNRSNGRIELKKPSVYSNFNRMEKQGQVSSYLQSSELGPNRKYYSITEKGRKYYAELKAEFDRLGFDVFRDYVSEDEKTEVKHTEIPATQVIENHETIESQTVEQDDFFDFSAFLTPSKETTEKPVEEATIEETQATNVITEEVSQPLTQEESVETPQETETVSEIETVQEKHDDAVLLKQEEYDPSYNQRIYDITKDFNNYRKRRSFAEDQMAIEETPSTIQDSQEKQQQNLENFKIALLASKGMHDKQASEIPTKTEPAAQQAQTAAQTTDEPKDDGVFITTHVERPKPSKYEPPKLRLLTEATLPAPKRDATIDPSHKDIISQLYARGKGPAMQPETQDSVDNAAQAIYDYDDLQDYYRTQNISFKTYQHDRPATKHNTNRLNAIVSGLTFTLMCLFSAVLFAILYTKHLTNPSTSFMYIILPGLYFIALCSDLYKLKATSWEPKALLPQWAMWLLTLMCGGVVVGLNFLCGMSASNIIPYLSSLILPLLLIFALLPFRYYLKRFVYIRYYK